MKKSVKRIQFIYQKNVKIWQNIDWEKMITLEHVWKDLSQHLAFSSTDTKYQFFDYQTKQGLPAWYHVDLLKDNHQISIEEVIQRYFSLRF